MQYGRITDVTDKYPPFPDVDSSGLKIGTGRSGGLHQSAVVRFIEQELGIAKEVPTGEYPWLRAFLGFSWERALERAFAELQVLGRGPTVVRPPEQICDGIALSPDGYNVDDDVLEEYKLTWKSLGALEKGEFQYTFQRWFWQAAGYARCLGLHKVRFFVFFIMGDYSFKKERGPQIRVLEYTFTDEELEENWRMIVKHAAIMRERGLA